LHAHHARAGQDRRVRRDVGLGEQHRCGKGLQVTPAGVIIDDVDDQPGRHTRPSDHRAGVDPVALGTGQNLNAGRIIADDTDQRDVGTQLSQAHRLVGALATQRLNAFPQRHGRARIGHAVHP